MKRINWLMAGFLISCLCLLFLNGCEIIDAGKRGYKYKTPPVTGDGWISASLEEVGLDEELIQKMMEDIDDGTYGELHSLVIIKNGSLVLEEYYEGYDRNDIHDTDACTRSVASILIGLAIQNGDISSVNTKLFDYFPQYANLNSTLKNDITLQHVLTMSSGLDWDEWEYSYSDPRNPWNLMYLSSDWMKFVLDTDMVNTPGDVWAYNSGGSVLLSGVIFNSTGMPAETYADQFLFKPLGITQYQWEHTPKGFTATHSFLQLRPRDMAKIGYLMLNNGRWRNKNILDPNWISESTADKIQSTRMGGLPYGYQWWIRTITLNGVEYRTFFAEGTGDQIIFVCKDLNLVVVATGGNYSTVSTLIVMISNFIMRAAVNV